jgi:hypothetical protein
MPVRSALALALALAIAPAVAVEPAKVAIFDLELVDTSLEKGAALPDQERRVALATAELRRLFTESGRLQLIDLAPQAETLRKREPLRNCNGCDEDIARALGADYQVLGLVQKTSNLILSFAITVKDVRSGQVVRAGQVDIRGNTDENWLRGVRWLVKNRLLTEPLPDKS